MMGAEVTIAIPTYNRLNLLKRALNSALTQEGSSIEVVVSDDGSTDGTVEFIRDISDKRVRCLISNKNEGMYVNMNKCLRAAHGKYFMMLSDDDYLEKGCVKSLLEPWYKHSSLVMSYGQWWYEINGIRKLQQSYAPELEDGFDYVIGCWQGKRPTIFHGAMFETQKIRDLGGIPKGYAQDTFLKQRIALEGMIAYVRVPVTTYNFHSGSTTCLLSLHDLIRGRDAVLKMCLNVSQKKGASKKFLNEIERLGEKQFQKDVFHGILSLYSSGIKRFDVLREAFKLKRYSKHSVLFILMTIFFVILFPRKLVLIIKKIYHNHKI